MATKVWYNDEAVELTDEDIAVLKPILEHIRDTFEPTFEQPEVTTLYITATYNEVHSDKPLNGHTVEFVLGYEVPVVEETPVV